MAVTLSNADNALKSVYLEVITNQLDNYVNPFFAKIKKTTNDIYGKEVKKLIMHGVNGGIGAGTEDGGLPKASGNSYGQITATLKNLYGTIEISDKAVRASQNNAGAFVNLLNAEMEGLIKSSKYNFDRMLMGDGTGKLCAVEIADGEIVVDDISKLAIGMLVDVRTADGEVTSWGESRKIVEINRTNNTIKFANDGSEMPESVSEETFLCVQGSWDKELTGLGALFTSTGTIYGLDKQENPWLCPHVVDVNGEISEDKLQEAIDNVEMNSGNKINFILCSMAVRRALQKQLSANRYFTDTATLDGGYNAITFNGIPVVSDRFCPEGSMYLLNTDDFELHQLCDWQWLEDDNGRILKQIPGKPVYSATLVKYAELVCSNPAGQCVLKNISVGK